MRTRIINLDRSVIQQSSLMEQARPAVINLVDWGPRIRLACRQVRYQEFERDLARGLGRRSGAPSLVFIGSGDFHHVSLALLRRMNRPCNLLVIDNHPDWMRGLPLLHCGTWLYHAARLPHVRQVFHVGGDVDFDNGYRRLAPWSFLYSGKIAVLPAVRRFGVGRWRHVAHECLRPDPRAPLTFRRMETLLGLWREQLAGVPLYISLDKDVLRAREAAVNWDSGHLTWTEVAVVLEAFLQAAQYRFAGMDVVGDWSPVRVEGLLRRYLHWAEHPADTLPPAEAVRRNEILNLQIVDLLQSSLGRKQAVAVPAAA
jgi:hypothetical protein